MDMLAALTWGQWLTTVMFLAICVLLILVILLQKGRGGGLAGAFGGVGGHSAFGAKTGDVFTWITVALTFLFILMACVGTWKLVPSEPETTITAEVAIPDGDEPAPEGAEPAGSDTPAG